MNNSGRIIFRNKRDAWRIWFYWSKIVTLTYCKNVDDLKLVHDFIRDKKYKNIYEIPRYALYLYMKRNHPERIIED